MRLAHASAVAIVVALFMPAVHGTQAPAPQPPAGQAPGAKPAAAQDADRKVAGGGIAVKGWQGKVDAGAAKQGLSTSDAKFAAEGPGFRITTGPATTYWNPAN